MRGNFTMDLLAFGNVFLEVVFGPIPALPGPGEEVYASEFAFSCGGAASVAGAARAVGASAGLATVLGDDVGTRVVEAYCARLGIDVSPSMRESGSATGVTAVLNAGEDRAFLSHLPAAAGPARNLEGWNAVVATHRPRWIYLHARSGAREVIDAARDAGCRVAVDTELGTIRRDRATVLACAAASDLFLPNRQELCALAGTDDLTAASAHAGTGTRTTIVVTDGPDGALVARNGTLRRIRDGLTAGPARDATGAGDAFAGALVGSLALGATLEDAVAAGNAAGSLAVGRLGAVGPVSLDGSAAVDGAAPLTTFTDTRSSAR